VIDAGDARKSEAGFAGTGIRDACGTRFMAAAIRSRHVTHSGIDTNYVKFSYKAAPMPRRVYVLNRMRHRCTQKSEEG
jgi:hypothetical protein